MGCAVPGDYEALRAAVVDPHAALLRVDLDVVRQHLTAAGFKAVYVPDEDTEAWFCPRFDGVRMPAGFGRQQRNPEGVERLRLALHILANATDTHPTVLLGTLVEESEAWRR